MFDFFILCVIANICVFHIFHMSVFVCLSVGEVLCLFIFVPVHRVIIYFFLLQGQVSTSHDNSSNHPGPPRHLRPDCQAPWPLHEVGLRARQPAVRLPLRGPGNSMRWNRQQWDEILLTDESRSCLKRGDGRTRVWRSRGERYAQN